MSGESLAGGSLRDTTNMLLDADVARRIRKDRTLATCPTSPLAPTVQRSFRRVTPGGALRAANMLLDTGGAALIIHSPRDDYQTDPSGCSGEPVACGVISSM